MTFVAGQKLRASQMPGFVCTSTTRPVGHSGQIIYETDTGFFMWYNGSDWDYLQATSGVAHEIERYQTTAQTVSNATDTPINWDTAVSTSSDVSIGTSTTGTISNGKITLNRAGIWTVNATIRWTAPNSGSQYGLWLGPDGGTTRYASTTPNAGGTAATDLSLSSTRRWSSGDTLSVYAYQSSGGSEATVNLNQGTHLTVTWIRP